MSHPVDALLEYLRAKQARGGRTVALDEEAREILRGWFMMARKAKRAGPGRGRGVQSGGPAAPKKNIYQAARAERGSAEPPPPAEPAPNFAELAREVAEEPAAPGEAAPAPAEPVAEGSAAAEKIASLAAQAENWAPARDLGTLRSTMVFSCGDPEADLMLVGEAPGYQEERQRWPFVGPAGQKLDAILKAMGLGREEVYISNIVKFRPSMPNQTTNNRKPTLDEMAACLPFVRAEVGIVKPKCIVALGGTAAEGLLGLPGVVARLRGQWHEFEGVPVRVTYHPAYLLHSHAGLSEKRKIWEDMLAVMGMLGLPVSEKQREFFLPKR